MPDLPAATSASIRRTARALPKVLLHEHLDGGLRTTTLLELLAARGIAAPAADPSALAAWFDARAHAGSLAEYLRGFELTVAAMASLDALERVAFEAAEDARTEGCVLAEFRIAPLLFEAHGLAGDAVVEALVAGLARSALPSGLIVCAMRHLAPAESVRVARLALRHVGRGVIGFDLAGAEAGHPPSKHAEAVRLAQGGGLGITLHAGEADGAERVLEAARLGATRIGHGVRLVDALRRGDTALMDAVRALDPHLEVCPTSNVHTGAAASIATHPIGELWRAGIGLSFHTDNRLMSRTTPSLEAERLMGDAGLGADDLLRMGTQAARRSFLAQSARDAAIAALERFATTREGAAGM